MSSRNLSAKDTKLLFVPLKADSKSSSVGGGYGSNTSSNAELRQNQANSRSTSLLPSSALPSASGSSRLAAARTPPALFSGDDDADNEDENESLLWSASSAAAASGSRVGGGLLSLPSATGGGRGACRACCGTAKRRRACIGITTALTLVFVLIAALVGYFVIAPSYVGNKIGSTTLVFTALSLTQPTVTALQRDTAIDEWLQRECEQQGRDFPGCPYVTDAAAATYSFTLLITAILSGLDIGGLADQGTIDPWTATLSYAGADVALVSMPAVTAKANVANTLHISAPVVVTDMTAFAAFGTAMVNSDRVTARLAGSVTVSTTVAGIPVSVGGISFDKSVTFAGAGGLKDASVTSFSLARSNATTAVADLSVRLWNPSIVSIQPLGIMALAVSYHGNDMGYAVASNTSLGAGWNTFQLTGVLSSSNASATEQLISSYLGGKSVTVTASGIAWPGTPPLYQPVVTALRLTASLPPSTNPLISAIEVSGMYLQPLGSSAVGIQLNVTVGVNNILGSPSALVVTSIAINCSLQGQGVGLGQLVVPDTPVPPQMNAHETAALVAAGHAMTDPLPLPVLNITVSLAAVLAIDTTSTQFAAFVLAFLQDSAVSLGLASNATSAMRVSLSCPLGDLAIAIPLPAVTTSVPGMASFPYVSVDGFQVIGVVDAGDVVPLPSSTSSSAAAPLDDMASSALLTGPAILTALNVTILNPSPAAFTLGVNATLGLFACAAPGAASSAAIALAAVGIVGRVAAAAPCASPVRLGYSTIYNTTLYAGYNHIGMIGVIKPDAGDAEALVAASSLFSCYLTGCNGTVTVVGESVSMGDGQVTPVWLQQAVTNITMQAVLPGLDAGQASSLLTDVQIGSLALDFGADGQLASPLVSGLVRSVLQLPFSIPVEVGSTNLSLAFIEPSSGIVMATLSMSNQSAGWYPCNTTEACDAIQPVEAGAGDGGGGGHDDVTWARSSPSPMPSAASDNPLRPVGVLLLSLSQGVMTITDADAFARLVTAVVNQPSVALRLAGTASPLVTTAIGTLALHDIAVAADITVPGMDRFSDPPIEVKSGDITNTSATGVTLEVGFNITTNAPISGRLGPVTLAISYSNCTFIQATIPDLVLQPGNNLLAAIGTFTLPDATADPVCNAAALEALSRFLRGMSSGVVVSGLGGSGSSPNPLLQPALAGLIAPATFPGMATRWVACIVAMLAVMWLHIASALLLPAVRAIIIGVEFIYNDCPCLLPCPTAGSSTTAPS